MMIGFLLLIKFYWHPFRNNKSKDFRFLYCFYKTVPATQYIVGNITTLVVCLLKLNYGLQVLSVSVADFVRVHYRSRSTARSSTGAS